MAMKSCQVRKGKRVVTKKGFRIAKGGRCVPAKKGKKSRKK
jgi:hypothetical protein